MKTTMRVLIVEDSEFMVSWLLAYLAAYHGSLRITCEVVVNLQAAMERLCGEKNIDVVLLDLNLSNSWGVATLRKIHTVALAANAGIVVLTGIGNGKIEQECIASGAHEFVAKTALEKMEIGEFVNVMKNATIRVEKVKEMMERYASVKQEIKEGQAAIQTEKKVIEDSKDKIDVKKESRS